MYTWRLLVPSQHDSVDRLAPYQHLLPDRTPARRRAGHQCDILLSKIGHRLLGLPRVVRQEPLKERRAPLLRLLAVRQHLTGRRTRPGQSKVLIEKWSPRRLNCRT